MYVCVLWVISISICICSKYFKYIDTSIFMYIYIYIYIHTKQSTHTYLYLSIYIYMPKSISCASPSGGTQPARAITGRLLPPPTMPSRTAPPCWEPGGWELCHYVNKYSYLVGGLQHFWFSIIYGILLPNWFSYFSEGLKPPTRYSLKQNNDKHLTAEIVCGIVEYDLRWSNYYFTIVGAFCAVLITALTRSDLQCLSANIFRHQGVAHLPSQGHQGGGLSETWALKNLQPWMDSFIIKIIFQLLLL